jgi:hypothetical protein
MQSLMHNRLCLKSTKEKLSSASYDLNFSFNLILECPVVYLNYPRGVDSAEWAPQYKVVHLINH